MSDNILDLGPGKENPDTIREWHLVSSNMGPNILNDVTRGDLVDIIDRMFVKSKASLMAEILQLYIDHTKNFGNSNPHELQMDQLIDTVFDRLYSEWLNQGYNGTHDDFRDVIYTYRTYANELSLYNGKDKNMITPVKSVYKYLTEHHDAVVNTYDNTIFKISERDTNWSNGIISGMELNFDKKYNDVPNSDHLTIYPNENGKVWYKWTIRIPQKLVHSLLTIKVDTDNSYTIKYRIPSSFDDWRILPEPLEISYAKGGEDEYREITTYEYHRLPTSIETLFALIPRQEVKLFKAIDIVDITTYRNELSVAVNDLLVGYEYVLFDSETWNNEVVYEFWLEFDDGQENNIELRDIVTQIDAITALTDNPARIEYYRTPPHENKLLDFFFVGKDELPDPKFAWYSHINSASAYNDVSWFNKYQGSFKLSVQPLPNRLTKMEHPEEWEIDSIITPFIRITGQRNSLFEISSIVTGMFKIGHKDKITEIGRIDTIRFNVTQEFDGESFSVSTGDMSGSHRDIFKLLVVYDVNQIKLWIHDALQGIISYQTNMTYMSPISPEVCTIYNSVDPNDDVLVGLHELVYYNDQILREEDIRILTFSDLTGVPYIKRRTVLN